MSADPLETIRTDRWQSIADPETDALPSSRVPHLGHALLFISIAGLLLLASQAIVLVPLIPPGASAVDISLKHPKLLLATEAGTYLATLAIAWFTFPLFWQRSFLAGISWNGRAALQHIFRLIPVGIFAGWAVQAISSLVAMPKTMPMDDFFRSPTDVWIVTLFGTLLAPLFEEMTFRGFLLPATAITCDWIGPALHYIARFSTARLSGRPPSPHLDAFPETAPAGLVESTGNLAFRSRPAILVSSLITSAVFAWMHAKQLGYTWTAVLLLACVSLILTIVRIRTRSVACSTVVHASYNFSVFLTLFIATGGYRHLDRMVR